MLILVVPILLMIGAVATVICVAMRRWKTVIIILLSVIGLNHYTQTIPLNLLTINKNNGNLKLRILTYNLGGLHNPSLQAKDYPQFLDFVDKQDADILVLPESRLAQREQLLNGLKDRYPYDISQGYVPGKHIYIETWVFSRYPLSAIKTLDHYSYSLLVTLPNGESAELVACHLSSNQNHSSLNKDNGLLSNIRQGYYQRSNETRALIDSLYDHDYPLLLCGDMNDLSGSPTLTSLQEKLHLDDAWWQGGLGYGATFTGKHLYFRLDHILYSPQYLELQHVDIPSATFSDHLPLVADFTLN